MQLKSKGKKAIVYKHKKRKKYHRKQGHRQNYITIKIVDILNDSGKLKKSVDEKKENVSEKTTLKNPLLKRP